MGTLILNEMKKRASGFLHDKYKSARLVLTDVTRAELLAEEATNNEPCSPDAKTMTRIAQASFEVDDYWRVVDVLHGRLYNLDWKLWRQSYKALVLLEFLLTHGPEDFAEEFQSDTDVIQEFGNFKHIDEKGFNWGACMQKKSERILKLLSGGEFFKEARLKAIKVTREIKGFGNLAASPSSSSSTTPSSSSSSSFGAARTSFGSYSTNSSTPRWNDFHEFNQNDQCQHHKDLIDELSKEKSANTYSNVILENIENLHLWDCPMKESGSLLDTQEGKDGEETKIKEAKYGYFDGIRSKLANVSSPSKLKSLSDVGKVMKKKFDRQFSMGY
ncbi:Epsin-2 [Thalictrum thalictroides]|uniref:Epsin-2 n=1 Tax=Thalictrum thalictroides TaxID=46969 RepID=A0A7J6VGH4_THATH|nr:Epsin-2 [Thalictrum thalictroides]